MGISHKYLAVLATVCALVAAPVAIGSGGAKATATPTHPKVGTKVQLKVTGMKPGEKVKVVETINSTGQQRPAIYPKAGSTGMLVTTVRAQIKGKHTWKFTGRTSKRSASTYYVVK